MNRNVGGFERPVRLAAGAALVVLGIGGYAGMASFAWIGIGQALASILVVLIGLVLVVTGAVRWCPISAALGINTHRRTRDDSDAGGDRIA